jgi:hypothetical protein
MNVRIGGIIDMELNIFGFEIHGNTVGAFVLAILLFVVLIIVLPLIIIWTANQMFRMGWGYNIQYWFGALVILLMFWALCPPSKIKIKE